MKSIKAAVAQITCVDGMIEHNLLRATEMVAEAKKNGADMVLFPEFMSQGYRLTEEIWDSAEPWDGPTVSWLRETSQRNNIFIGTSFLEAKDGQFLNTFAMTDPSGTIAGIVRKRYPSMWEAYFFRGWDGDHVFNTEIGRIGVGICFDNHTYKVASAISAGNPDLVLMPHSYCTPTLPGKLVSADDIERLRNRPVEVAQLYNSFLGVPVVLVNKSGKWDSPVPNRMFGSPENFAFSGRSTVIDSDGTIKCSLADGETIGYGIISLMQQPGKNHAIPRHSRYIYPGPAGRELIRLIELQGFLSYSLNKRRQAVAKKIVQKFENNNSSNKF